MGSTRRMSNPGAAPRGPHWAWRRARRGRRQGTDPFVRHRSLLFTVAYEMLGTAFDAEEVVQETWLRWAGVDRTEVRDPRAHLVRVLTNQALDQVRTPQHRWETRWHER
jgi:DNA-directed RNA polymerase specialized sigma24 family protein